MNNIDLYNKLGLNRFFQGFSIIYNDLEIQLESRPEIIQQIDNICLTHNFIPLKEEWKELNLRETEDFFQSSLRFNIGFKNHENMSKEKAQSSYLELTNSLNLKKCRFFTNWYNNPWTNNNQSTGINTISEATLDLAIIIVDADKLLFHFISFED